MPPQFTLDDAAMLLMQLEPADRDDAARLRDQLHAYGDLAPPQQVVNVLKASAALDAVALGASDAAEKLAMAGRFLEAAMGGSLFAAAPAAPADSATFPINANGANEVTAGGVPNQGDPDGTAIGTLLLDSGTGSGNTGFATINITLNNIDLTTLSGHHIHQAPSTTTGSIVIDFGDPDTIRTGSLLSGTINGLPAATIANALANPSGFYYNIHNGAFPGGAVRSQLTPVPEPGSLALVGAAGLGLAAWRRQRRA